MEAVNHEGHRMPAERAARVLAFTELEGDHEDVEALVYSQVDECWQCIAVALVTLLRDPVDPETLRTEAEAIKQEMWADAFWHAKHGHEKEQEPQPKPLVLGEDPG
jgi:hypothetical protein